MRSSTLCSYIYLLMTIFLACIYPWLDAWHQSKLGPTTLLYFRPILKYSLYFRYFSSSEAPHRLKRMPQVFPKVASFGCLVVIHPEKVLLLWVAWWPFVHGREASIQKRHVRSERSIHSEEKRPFGRGAPFQNRPSPLSFKYNCSPPCAFGFSFSGCKSTFETLISY